MCHFFVTPFCDENWTHFWGVCISLEGMFRPVCVFVTRFFVFCENCFGQIFDQNFVFLCQKMGPKVVQKVLRTTSPFWALFFSVFDQNLVKCVFYFCEILVSIF